MCDMTVPPSIPQQLVDQLSQCFTSEGARKLVELRADPETQARVAELADKCTEGTLTLDEQSEYDAYVYAANFIALLQAKARARLAHNPAA
jgi:hypothetical protein